MKKFILAAMLSSLAGISNAESVNLINGDGSELTELCIQAYESGMDAVDPISRREVLCNGMPLNVFVKRTRGKVEQSYTTVKFSMRDESELTQLCMAAIESQVAYEAVKEELFDNTAGLDSNVLCNGMPIMDFARKYRNRAVTASL